MDIVTTDSIGQSARVSPTLVIGWWCLFDTDEVWEWGRAILANLYRQPFTSHLGVSETFLQQSSNQSIRPREPEEELPQQGVTPLAVV